MSLLTVEQKRPGNADETPRTLIRDPKVRNPIHAQNQIKVSEATEKGEKRQHRPDALVIDPALIRYHWGSSYFYRWSLAAKSASSWYSSPLFFSRLQLVTLEYYKVVLKLKVVSEQSNVEVSEDELPIGPHNDS